jgi:hypothetical protein
MQGRAVICLREYFTAVRSRGEMAGLFLDTCKISKNKIPKMYQKVLTIPTI